MSQFEQLAVLYYNTVTAIYTQSSPDPVGVPLLMDNNLSGGEGHGASLVGGLQTVFAQIDLVGVAAAAGPPENRDTGQGYLDIWSP